MQYIWGVTNCVIELLRQDVCIKGSTGTLWPSVLSAHMLCLQQVVEMLRAIYSWKSQQCLHMEVAAMPVLVSLKASRIIHCAVGPLQFAFIYHRSLLCFRCFNLPVAWSGEPSLFSSLIGSQHTGFAACHTFDQCYRILCGAESTAMVGHAVAGKHK